MRSDIVYRSSELMVVRNRPDGCLNAARYPTFVTFQSDEVAFPKDENTSQIDLFGAKLVDMLGIQILHVAPSVALWYHHQDMQACLDSIKPLLGPDTIAYGASMGGYAAARFADTLGISRVFALAPQASIQPSVVPFETRWPDYVERIRFLHDDDWPARQAKIWLFYDKAHRIDPFHADIIAKAGPSVRVNVPYCGHWVARGLVEAGIMKEIITRFRAGTEDKQAFRKLISDNILNSATAQLNRAAQLEGQPRFKALRQAYRLNPENRHAAFQFGLALLQQDKTERAERVLEKALALAALGSVTEKYWPKYLSICKQKGIPASLTGAFLEARRRTVQLP
jgi:hypothetical protein